MGLDVAAQRFSLQVLLALAGLGLSLQAGSLVFPLTRRDGGLLARGLLRNATLPLHGAVKDYG